MPLKIKHRHNVTKSMTQSLSGCLRLNIHEVRVSEDEMFAACMIEAIHPLDLSWLFPLALKNSLNLKDWSIMNRSSTKMLDRSKCSHDCIRSTVYRRECFCHCSSHFMKWQVAFHGKARQDLGGGERLYPKNIWGGCLKGPSGKPKTI